MDKSGNFTIRTNPVDGTTRHTAIIDFKDGAITVVKGEFESSKAVFNQAMIEAGKIIDASMRLRYPHA